MDVNKDFDRPHDVYVTVQFKMYGIQCVPSDKIIDALRLLDVLGDIDVRAVDMESGDEIYKHERKGCSVWKLM